MKNARRLCRLFVISSLCFITGCYDRLTLNYTAMKELSGQDKSSREAAEYDEKNRTETLVKILAANKKEVTPYTINSGDSIAISVYNHPDLSLNRTVVTTDGYIGMVLVGQIKVSGMTLANASRAIEKELSQYIRNPKVGIAPLEIRSETATIAGAVSKPGMYTISQGMRLGDLFALAGGSPSRLYDGQTLDAADFSKSIFVRDGKRLPVNFVKAITLGDPIDNVLLRKGDYIYIATRDNSMVYVLGDVKSAQRRVLTPNMGLLELIVACGGMNETYWPYAIIIRGGVDKPKIYKADLDGILHGKKPNVLLESGDIIYIPHDDISEYNVFIRKLFPTAQLVNLISTPMFWYSKF